MTHRNVLNLLGKGFSCCSQCFLINEIFLDDDIITLEYEDEQYFYIKINWKSGKFLDKDNVFLRFHNYRNKIKFEKDLQTVKTQYPKFDNQARDPRHQLRSHLGHLSDSGIVKFLGESQKNGVSYRLYQVLRVCDLAHRHVVDTFQLELLPPTTKNVTI